MIWRKITPELRKTLDLNTEDYRYDAENDEWYGKYLERHYILSTPFFGAYIHRFWADDLDGLHDHPWDSFSLVLEGGYLERIAGETQPLIRMEGDTHYRTACEAHRITLLPGDEPGSCWTLFIRFRRKRTWGFYTSEWFPAPKQSRRDDDL